MTAAQWLCRSMKNSADRMICEVSVTRVVRSLSNISGHDYSCLKFVNISTDRRKKFPFFKSRK
jgi:hypothetical protein